MAAINIGSYLPDLVLKNERGEDVRVAEIAADRGFVLFLVPKAGAAWCTRHARGFKYRYNDFMSCGVRVYCLSADSPTSQSEWQVNNRLPYPLLSDPDKVLINALGAGGGRKTTRSHFIFAQGGKLVNKKIPVKPAESPRLALKFVTAHDTSPVLTEQNILDVKAIFLKYLPLELVDTILDNAEYWLVSKSQRQSAPRFVLKALSFPKNRASYCYTISAKIPGRSQLDGSRFRVRKVAFRIRSHDQGWRLGIEELPTDPYTGSYTWFEAAIIRGLGGDGFINDPNTVASAVQGSTVLQTLHHDSTFSPPAPWAAVQLSHPSNGTRVWPLQRNRRSDDTEAFHEIAWLSSDDGPPEAPDEPWTISGTGHGFVRLLEPGDRIAVYARAIHPGGQNYVRGVDILIFYST